LNNDSLESRLLTANTHTRALACLCALIAGLISLPSNSSPTAAAVALKTRPTLDGDVLNDPAWKTTNINQFWQQRPVEGSPASQKTEVFIGYTDRALYIGVICYDTNPEGIIVSDSRRDADLETLTALRSSLTAISINRTASFSAPILPASNTTAKSPRKAAAHSAPAEEASI